MAGVLYFEIVGKISSVETIASGREVRKLKLLIEQYGVGRWRKL